MALTVQERDSRIKQAVIEELEWCPEVDSARVGVSVSHGAVSLSGQVRTFAERTLAERAVLRVHGVNSAAQELHVDTAWPPAGDTDLAAAALQALDDAAEVPPGAVQIVVERGKLTLSGLVSRPVERESAERAVRYLRGVTSIDNLIAVGTALTAQEISLLVREELSRAGRDIDRVTVFLDGDTVTLTGSVESWPERRAADEAAWSTPGVRSVCNRLLVQPS